jgi:hypothetical protein
MRTAFLCLAFLGVSSALLRRIDVLRLVLSEAPLTLGTHIDQCPVSIRRKYHGTNWSDCSRQLKPSSIH